MTGKHPADLCAKVNKGGSSCHNCAGHASTEEVKTDDIISEIAKKVMEQLGLK